MAGMYFFTTAMFLCFPLCLFCWDRFQRRRMARESLDFWAEAYEQAAREYAKRIR